MALGAHDALGPALERMSDRHEKRASRSASPVAAGRGGHESAHPSSRRALARGRPAAARVGGCTAGCGVTDVSHIGWSIEPGGGARARDLAGELEQLCARGLAEGIPIGELNSRRARLSRIKCGRLTARLAGRPARAFFLSDVPDDDPAVIGSGLLGPAADGPDRIERRVIASVERAVEGVATAALQRGLTVERVPRRFDGEATRLAARFTHELLIGNTQVRVWGGESTVHLPPNPGRGGRNQHLALAAAKLLPDYPELMLLAAGTDGTDGPTEAAGGLVSAETWGGSPSLGSMWRVSATRGRRHGPGGGRSAGEYRPDGNQRGRSGDRPGSCPRIGPAHETHQSQSQCFGGVFTALVYRLRSPGPPLLGYPRRQSISRSAQQTHSVALKVERRTRCGQAEATDSFLRFLQEYEIAQRIRRHRHRAALRPGRQRRACAGWSWSTFRAAICAAG